MCYTKLGGRDLICGAIHGITGWTEHKEGTIPIKIAGVLDVPRTLSTVLKFDSSQHYKDGGNAKIG